MKVIISEKEILFQAEPEYGEGEVDLNLLEVLHLFQTEECLDGQRDQTLIQKS